MKEINCSVIADLLPLYAEGLCSEATKEMIEAHLTECADCRAALAALRAPAPLPKDDGSMLKKLRRRVLVQKARWAVFAALMALLIGTLYTEHMNAPITLPAETAVLSVEPSADGQSYTVLLSSDVINWDYTINQDNTVFITAWTTRAYMNKDSRHTTLQRIPTPLNWYGSLDELYPDEGVSPDAAARVYYYSAANPNGEDVLVYKDDNAPVPMRTGVITLPRLTLNYYMYFAAALALVCGILTAALKIAKKLRRAWAMLCITMVPLCYAAASAVILHGKSDIYNVEHYLSAILLITVILNLLFKIIVLLFRKGE